MPHTKFYPLRVKEIIAETADTSTLVFEVPEDYSSLFAWKAGQYLTVSMQIDGVELRRAYSISASPALQTDLSLSVKKVEGGKMSPILQGKTSVGDILQVMPPQGRFVFEPDANRQRAFYLIGAGSGITPLMSILQTVLEAEPLSTVYLLYGSRSEENIIFKEKLLELQGYYTHQLFVEHVLSKPVKQKPAGIGGWLKKPTAQWNGRIGRIDKTVFDQFRNEFEAPVSDVRYYICGPSGMMKMVEETLAAEGVSDKNVFVEHFSVAPVTNGVKTQGEVEVTIDGRTSTVFVAKGKTILDAMISQKMDPPYSCISGACSTCMAKVIRGRVKMDSALSLEKEEIEMGYILTCQAHPDSDDVAIIFE